MNIALICINYNQNKLTNELITDLEQNKNKHDAHLFIIDVSDKNQAEPLITISFPHTVIREQNKGYSYGVNRGIESAQKKGMTNFCVLNNDVMLKSNFITSLQKSFEKYDVFGGKIYYAPGFEFHKDRYQKSDLGMVLWYAGGIIDWNNVYTKHRGVDEVDRKQYDSVEKTEFITGCLFCFTQKVIDKVGFWDESYFLYYEDADYSQRCKKNGFSLYYNPNVLLWHKNAQSTGGAGSQLHKKYQRINRLRFGLKYASWRTKLHLIKNYISGNG